MKGDAVTQESYEQVRGESRRYAAKVHEKGTGGQLYHHGSQSGEALQLGGRIFVSRMRNEQFGEDVLKAFAQIRAESSWRVYLIENYDFILINKADTRQIVEK